MYTPKMDPVWKRCWSVVLGHLTEYCSKSGIHGLQYLGEKQRPLLERVIWMSAFVLSLAASLLLIGKTWIKWEESPVIVSMEDHMRSVWELPFPAVTICPETKVLASLFDYLDVDWRYRNHNATDYEKKVLFSWEMICGVSTTHWGNATGDQSHIDIIEELAPQMLDTVTSTLWQQGLDRKYMTDDFFRPLLTDEGVCFTANMLPAHELFPASTFHASGRYLRYNAGASEWDVDDGYRAAAGLQTYPRRTLGAGIKAGLTVRLRMNSTDLDEPCNGPISGFKILLHSPAEFPLVGQQYLRVPLDQKVEVAVKPNLMTTSPLLHGYTPERRQCYFSTERKLSLFKVYTHKNCAFECLTNYTLSKCGCVALYMPRHTETPICGPSKNRCIWNVPIEFLQQEVNKQLHNKDSRPHCGCLQSCTELQFSTERSQSSYDWKTVRPTFFNNSLRSEVSIFFKNVQFLGFRRSELYGQTDFFANCGGLLGLGMGFSILSLVELLYWLCLRIWITKGRVGNTNS